MKIFKKSGILILASLFIKSWRFTPSPNQLWVFPIIDVEFHCFFLGGEEDVELDGNKIEDCLGETRNSWREQSLTLNRYGALNIVGLAY